MARLIRTMSQAPTSDSQIDLRFDKFSSFVEGYSASLSLGGIFLATEDLRPVGSTVSFAIGLADGFHLIEGVGEVIWVRLDDEGPDEPTGMGVRFQALNDKGRELVLKLLEERVRGGGEPFDVEVIPPGAVSRRDAGTVQDEEPEEPAPEPMKSEPANEPPSPEPFDLEAMPELVESETVAESPVPEPFDLEAAPEPPQPGPLAREPAVTESAPAPATMPSELDVSATGPKILGEDGFTLLDAESPSPTSSTTAGSKSFEELEFDAPWGADLPELPVDVLGEDPENSAALPDVGSLTVDLPAVGAAPSPAPPASAQSDRTATSGSGSFEMVSADDSSTSLEGVFAVREGGTSPAIGDGGEATNREGPSGVALDDSFLLAAEAADEIKIASETAGAPDFEEIDFEVSAGDEAELLSGFVSTAETEVHFDDSFELDPEPLAENLEPAPEEDLTVVGGPYEDLSPALPEIPDDEDPTLLGTPPAGSPSFDVATDPFAAGRPSSEALEVPEWPTTFEEVAPAAPSHAERPEPVTEPPAAEELATSMAPVSPEVPVPVASVGLDDSVDPVPVSDTPAAIEDYEEDLFAEEPRSGRLMRGASRVLVALAALVLVLAGAAYFFRDQIGELLGPRPSQQPVGTSGTDAAPPQAIEMNSPTDEGTDPTTGESADELGDRSSEETPSAALEEVDVATDLPPGIDLSTDPARVTPPPAISGSSPATRIERIDWRRSGTGTLVTVSLDGHLADERYSHSSLSYAPAREMIKVSGMAEPYVSGRIDVGSAELQQIRTGFHTESAGNTIHVVLDYPGAGPHVASVRNLGDRLEILIAGP